MRTAFYALAFLFGMNLVLGGALVAQGVNPDPFNTKGTPTTTVPAPGPGGQVVVSVPPAPQNNFTQYLWMMVISTLGAVFGIPQIKQAFSSPVSKKDFKNAIEAELVQIIQSGKLAPVVQTGLGMIPGVGGLAAQGEPLIRKVLLELLQQHGVVPSTTSVNPAPQAGDLFAALEKLIDAKLAQAKPAA